MPRPWTPSSRLVWGLSLAQTAIWLPLCLAGVIFTAKESTGTLVRGPKELLIWLALAGLYGGLGALGGVTGLGLAARSSRTKELDEEERRLRQALVANVIGGGLQLLGWFIIFVMLVTIPGGIHGRPSWR